MARIESLGKIKGIESVVTAATAAQGESQARFLLESVGMLAEAHRKETPLVEIRMSNLVPAGITSGGRLVAAVGIDYGIWDKDAAAFVQRKGIRGQWKNPAGGRYVECAGTADDYEGRVGGQTPAALCKKP